MWNGFASRSGYNRFGVFYAAKAKMIMKPPETSLARYRLILADRSTFGNAKRRTLQGSEPTFATSGSGIATQKSLSADFVHRRLFLSTFGNA